MKIKGETLLEIIEAATCSLPSQIGAFPQVSGIRYTVNTKVPYETGSSMKIHLLCARQAGKPCHYP